jgi:hypothetical protein
MTSVFDKITEKSYIDLKKDEYLELFKKDLENYHDKETEVSKLYVKLLGYDKDDDADDVEDTYWVLKTYDSLNYNSLIISWIENNFDRYKKINEDLINAGAQNNYSYDKAIKMNNEYLPGNYNDHIGRNIKEVKKTLINKFNLSKISIDSLSSQIDSVIDGTTDSDIIYSNMKILYDLSTELYNDDTALKLCSIMINPDKFNDLLRKLTAKGSVNVIESNKILEYFFHLVPTIPGDNIRLKNNDLQELYIFTSQRPKDGRIIDDRIRNIYEINPLTMLKYDDCLLDTVLFKNLYTKVTNDHTIEQNSTLFVFNFRLITNLNKIVNGHQSAVLTSDFYYLTMLANTMSELHYKNLMFKKFLSNENNISIINNVYEDVMKDITPVNVYIKVNNMIKDTDTNLNPRYNFQVDNKDRFFKDLKLTYINSEKKVGFDRDGNYTNYKAINDLRDGKKEYYNLGKINGYYDNDESILNDENCGELLIKRIDNGENVIIIGNGQSGSGKTASLIYLKKENDDIEGILPKILNKLNSEYNKITLRLADIYLNWDSQLNNIEKITNKHYMVKPIKQKDEFEKYNEIFEFTKNMSGNWSNNQNYLLGKFINELFKSREIQPTKNNPDSSRSHVLVLVEIYKDGKESPHSKLVICDLAGVEDEFTCNCEQLVNLLNIYRTKSEKYKDDNLVDNKLYFDNYTCSDSDYQTNYQKIFFNNSIDNLTKERSETIYNLYKFVNQVEYQLSNYSGFDDNVVIMHPDIDNLNLGTFVYKGSTLENYETNLDPGKLKENFYCINNDKELEMKEKLRDIMEKTSGKKQTNIYDFYDNYNLLEMTNFYKFYNVSESDDIDKMLEQMFALYNIYMKLYNYIRYIADDSNLKYNDNIIYTTEDLFNKYETEKYKLRYKSVSKLNDKNKFMKNFTDNKNVSLSDIFIKHLQDSLLNGLLLSNNDHIQYEPFVHKTEFNIRPDKTKFRNYPPEDPKSKYMNVVIGNSSHGLYYTKEKTNYDDQDIYNKNSFNYMNTKDKLDGILKKLSNNRTTLTFKSDSRRVLYTIFNEYIKNNESKAYTDIQNKKYYLYSGFICKTFLSSIKRIINQIVGDIIRMKIMNFNCKLRRKEGYFINRSLAEMQKSLSSVILRELHNKTVSNINLEALKKLPNIENIKDKLIILNYLSPISDNCYKDNYMNNDFNFNNFIFDKNVTIPRPFSADKFNSDNSEIILRIIFDNGFIMEPTSSKAGVDGENYRGFGLDPRIINPNYSKNKDLEIVNYEHKTTSIIVFTVINLTDNGIVNNPPNPPYINTNNLKRIYNISSYFTELNNRKIIKAIDDNIKSQLQNLDTKFMNYKTKFIKRAIKYDFYMKDKTIQDINKNITTTNFGKIFNERLIDQTDTLKVIDFIDSNNKTTLIGTISFDVFTQPFTQPRRDKKYRFYICDGNGEKNNNNYIPNKPDEIDIVDDIIDNSHNGETQVPVSSLGTGFGVSRRYQ